MAILICASVISISGLPSLYEEHIVNIPGWGLGHSQYRDLHSGSYSPLCILIPQFWGVPLMTQCLSFQAVLLNWGVTRRVAMWGWMKSCLLCIYFSEVGEWPGRQALQFQLGVWWTLGIYIGFTCNHHHTLSRATWTQWNCSWEGGEHKSSPQKLLLSTGPFVIQYLGLPKPFICRTCQQAYQATSQSSHNHASVTAKTPEAKLWRCCHDSFESHWRGCLVTISTFS